MLALHCYICRVFPFFSTRELFGSVFLCGTCTLYSMCTELWVPCQHPAQVTAAAARIGQNVDEHPRSNPFFFFTPLQANFLLCKDLFFYSDTMINACRGFILNHHFDFECRLTFFLPSFGLCYMCEHMIRSLVLITVAFIHHTHRTERGEVGVWCRVSRMRLWWPLMNIQVGAGLTDRTYRSHLPPSHIFYLFLTYSEHFLLQSQGQ